MMTLSDFLLARIAEDEKRANDALDAEPKYLHFGDTAADALLGLAESEGADTFALLHFGRHRPARVLADCEAKRRIVGLAEVAEEEGAEYVYRAALKALALPYAGDPDYQDAWRP